MTAKVTRRNFLKLSGTAAASLLVLSGCTFNLQQQAWMEPYPKAPEETLPGEDLWFASTCRMCPAGCGTLVRVSNGRARKIEGNPEHPLNQGKLCARGQAGLQELYHPDRLRQVQKRTGERGQGQWNATTWDQIIDDIATHLQKTHPAKVAFLTGYLPHYQSELVGRFLKGLKAAPVVMYDTQTALDGRTVLEAANQALFANTTLPVFDLAQADLIFGFGANFLETWLSPTTYSQAYGAMRGRPGNRGVFIAFEPRLSMTAANADRWIPVQPGAEGLVALALGKIIIDEKLTANAGKSEFKALYANIDVAAIAKSAALKPEQLVAYARMFAAARHAVALPGSYVTAHTNGLDAAKAVAALNLLVANEAWSGMALTPDAPGLDLQQASANSFQDVQALTKRMADGEIDTLFILGANPVYELPAALNFKGVLAKVAQVITFDTLPTETTALADIVLPAHTYLETWGYQFVNPGMDQVMVSAQQPVVQPLYDSREPGDVLLALANKLGGNVAKRLPWPNLITFIQTRLTSLQLLKGNITAADAKTFWTDWLQHGGWWAQEKGWARPEPSKSLNAALTVAAPTFAGDAASYPFYLLPVPSVIFGDGRHAGLPWLQETPDPMTTAAWDTWVEINPTTAAKLGVQNNDVVKISSATGEIMAVVYLYPGIRPDTLAVPVGQGHTGLGRWAQNRGANVLAILAPQVETQTGQWAWAATRVQVTKTATQRQLPVLESNIGVDRMRQQGIVPTADLLRI